MTIVLQWREEEEEEEKEENSVSDDINESENDFYEAEPNYEIDKKTNFVLEEVIDLNNSIFTDGNNNENQIHLNIENNINQLIDESYEYNLNNLINSFLSSFDVNIVNMNNLVNLEAILIIITTIILFTIKMILITIIMIIVTTVVVNITILQLTTW
jgi:hypothetical protein